MISGSYNELSCRRRLSVMGPISLKGYPVEDNRFRSFYGFILVGDSFDVVKCDIGAKGDGVSCSSIWNLWPLKMIDGVSVGWTELGRVFWDFSIAVNNCPYNLFVGKSSLIS